MKLRLAFVIAVMIAVVASYNIGYNRGIDYSLEIIDNPKGDTIPVRIDSDSAIVNHSKIPEDLK
jgi:hypothetical protein